ncbi:MAG: hypothetical protein IPN53_24265 [Comamonadaceae bacterium]|nr:hypothetical protein [Comamonadaceae bacterium]
MAKKDLYIAEIRRLLDHWSAHDSRNETGDQELVQEVQCDSDVSDEVCPQRSHASMTPDWPLGGRSMASAVGRQFRPD